MNKYTLDQLTLNLIDGKHGGCSEKKNSGYYFISVKDLKPFYIDYSDAKQISKEDYLQCHKRTKLENGDTIYANSGDTIGKSVFIENEKNVNCTTFQKSVAILKPNQELIYPKYLYYLMKYETPRLRRLSSGSAQKNLLLDTMKKLEVEIPDLNEQKKILNILDPFDNLIKHNISEINYIQDYLEKIYNYWFVQFNFPDDTQNEYLKNGGKLEYNDKIKNNIPTGWKVENLSNCSLYKLIKPGINKFDGEKVYLATGNVVNEDFDDGSDITYENREGRANMQPACNSVWFAKMKNSIKHITIPDNSLEFINEYILSTGFMGFQCDETTLSYIHSFINFSNFEYIKNCFSHGATQEAINNDDLKKIYIIVPPKHILEKFSAITYTLIRKRFELLIFNKNLEQERNNLMNYLMNNK